MNEKHQHPIEASGSLAITGTEIKVPSHDVRDGEKTSDVMTIDYNNQHANPRRQMPARQAAGPRTELGKQRSSRNAIRHGIFSEGILLKGESRAQLDSVRTRLGEAFLPEGGAEELLVDQLVSTSWRYRRFLVAERAEIQKSTECLEWDQHNQQHEEAEEIAREEVLDDENGLIWKIRNPEILKRCLELLGELREEIKATGLQYERDTSILNKIYGEKKTLRETPRDHYQVWVETANIPQEERAREGYATPEECKEEVLDLIDEEIKRLKLFQRKNASVESQRTKIEILRHGVPEAGLDRLLRYEARLQRDFDRTLERLERLQRLRLGQPVAPRLEVSLSKLI